MNSSRSVFFSIALLLSSHFAALSQNHVLTQVFTDSIMGIQFNTPAKLEHSTSHFIEETEGWYTHSFAGTDIASGTYVMLESREVMPGYYIESNNDVFAELRQRILQIIKEPKEETSVVQGRRVLIFSGPYDQRAGLYGKVLATVRGNRSIVLVVQADSAHFDSPLVNEVFNSFTFLRQQTEWNEHLSPDSSFSAPIPVPFSPGVSITGDYFLTSYDTVTATTCFIFTDTLGKYHWVNDEADLWKNYLESGPVVYWKSVQNGQVYGREYLLRTGKRGDRYQRIRLLVNGRVVYKLVVSGNRELVESENVNRFFSAFRVHAPFVAPSYMDSKAAKLLSDLFSEDAVTALNASAAVVYAPFTKSDLPLLHDALFKTGVVQDIAYIYVSEVIGKRIAEWKSLSSIEFIREQYPALVGKKSALRSVALATLANMRSQESFACIAELLSQSPPSTPPGFDFVQALRDSLSLAAAIYPSLLKLAGNTAMAGDVADILLQLRDSGYISTAELAGRQEDFVRATTALLSASGQADKYAWALVPVTELLAELKPPAFSKLVPSLLKVKNKYVRLRIMAILLKYKHAVPAQAIGAFAADAELRANLYSELNGLNRVDLFPKKYLTQQYFAESCIYVATQDAKRSRIEFLSQKKANVKGKACLFYLYKVTYNEEGEVYLGIAGAFDEAGKKIEPEEYITDVFWNERFDPDRTGEFLEQFIMAYENEEM